MAIYAELNYGINVLLLSGLSCLMNSMLNIQHVLHNILDKDDMTSIEVDLFATITTQIEVFENMMLSDCSETSWNEIDLSDPREVVRFLFQTIEQSNGSDVLQVGEML